MPSQDANEASTAQGTPEKLQPWRSLPGMPPAGGDEQFEAGTKGVVKSTGSIRLDTKADTGTNLGG